MMRGGWCFSLLVVLRRFIPVIVIGTACSGLGIILSRRDEVVTIFRPANVYWKSPLCDLLGQRDVWVVV